MRLIAGVGLVAGAMVAVPAQANRYHPMVIDAAGGRFLALDTDTIREVDGKPRAWSLSIGMTGEVGPFYFLVLSEYDCKGERGRDLSSTIYNIDGVMKSQTGEKPWTYYPPDTTFYRMMKRVCNSVWPADRVATLTTKEMVSRFRDMYSKRHTAE